MKRYPINAISLRGNASDEKAFMTASGTSGSAYEHTTIEELHQDAQAVSAVKILSIANQQGIPIYSIDSANSSTILPLLQISSESLSDIQNAIAAGKRVIVPGQSIQYYDWHGDGYIITDSDGAGAYVISGGLNGSGTTQKADILDTSLSNFMVGIEFILDAGTSIFKALSKLGIGGSELADSLGHSLAVISAFASAYDVYKETNCAWKAGAAAGADFALSVWAGAEISAAIGMVFYGSLVASIFIPILIVLLISIIAYILSQLVEMALESFEFCLNFNRKYSIAMTNRTQGRLS